MNQCWRRFLRVNREVARLPLAVGKRLRSDQVMPPADAPKLGLSTEGEAAFLSLRRAHRLLQSSDLQLVSLRCMLPGLLPPMLRH